MKFFGRSVEAATSVRDGDRFRDAGQWLQAADAYANHLDRNPSDVAILVQAGNCLKEAGNYEMADGRYRAALLLDPHNGDAHLQYGHLMKRMGRAQEAIESYRRSAEEDPENRHAISELVAAGAKNIFESPEVGGSTQTIWLDITDLMEYASVNKSLSGIQRVVANLIKYIERGVIGNYRVLPVIPEYDRHRILAVSSASAAMLVRQFDVPVVERGMIDKAIAAIYETRVEVWPTAGDIFLVAGAFWIYPHYDVISAFRKVGMRFGVFIHDLIQIKNPEFVQKEAIDKFQRQLIDVLSVADFVLTNSQFVASEITAYFEHHLNYTLPVQPILLPTELRPPQSSSRVLSDTIRAIAGEDYILCVATIEVRKNHMYQIRVWERLVQDLGENAPRLVWVGKWGWQVDELRQHLAERGYVGDWLFIFNDISDDELEYLYRHCLFTIYTSFAEGFGLPIGESLAYKKPCIASNVTSMPEVGGRFVKYIDPRNPDDGYRVVRSTLDDRLALTQWTADIAANFVPKTWETFCGEFFSSSVEIATRSPTSPASPNCFLPKSEIIEGGDDALLQLAAERRPIITFRAARDTGWFSMENWGVWSSQRRSTLLFETDLTAGTTIRIYLEVKCPPNSHDTFLAVNAGSQQTSFRISDQAKFISFVGIVDQNRRVLINLLARGRYGDTGHRSCHIGLTTMAYCEEGDPFARIELLEKVTLFRLQRL